MFETKSAGTLGLRRQRITFQKMISVTGLGGRIIHRFENLAQAWAEVETNHHSPVVRGDKLEFPSTIRFTTHFVALFKDARRIIMDGRTFEVLSVNNPKALSQSLEFRAREIFV